MEFLTLAEGFKITIVTDEDWICLYNQFDFKEKIFKRLKEGEIPAAIGMLTYALRPAVVIKTQLVVPDNRHCNAVTLSELLNSDNVHF